MVLFEGIAVCFAEGVGQLFRGIVDVVTEGLSGEVETSIVRERRLAKAKTISERPRFLWFSSLDFGRHKPDKPDQTFCCNMFPSLQLVEHKGLKCSRFAWGRQLPLSNFLHVQCTLARVTAKCGGYADLDIASQVVLDRGECGGTEEV